MILTIKPLKASLYWLLLGNSLILKQVVASLVCESCGLSENLATVRKSDTCKIKKYCGTHHCGEVLTIELTRCTTCDKEVKDSSKKVETCSGILHEAVCDCCEIARKESQ